MAISQASTVQTLNALNRVQSDLHVTTRRLSTGQQIPQAALNPAALGIAKSLLAELGSQTQATSNVNYGVSLLQTAEGGLGSIQDQLGRLQQLAVQGSSDTLTASQRASLNQESDSIVQEINRQAATTNFNGQPLLNGALASGVQVQAGVAAGDTVTLQIADSRAAALGIASSNNLSTASSSQAFLDKVQTAISAVSTRRAQVGASQNRLDSALRNLGESHANTAAGYSQIADADIAVQAAQLVRGQILQKAGLSVLGATANAAFSTVRLVR